VPLRRSQLSFFEMSDRTNSPLSSRLLLLLYLEFVLTGIVTTLLGPLIPLYVKRCAMSDADARLLVGAQFVGHFAGALFANRNLRRSVIAGMPLTRGNTRNRCAAFSRAACVSWLSADA